MIGGPAPKSRRTRVLLPALLVLALLPLHLLDRSAFFALYREGIERHDWYQLLRIIGDMRTWLVVAVCWFAATRRGAIDRALRQGLSIVLGAIAGGAGAELLKLIIGRERPAVLVEGGREFQGYVFKAWDLGGGVFGGFSDGSNLGLPSSHTAVAFAGAAAVARLLPDARLVLIVLAAGCGLSRLLHGAHFLTDVWAGALVGYTLSALVSRALVPSAGRTA